MTPLEQEICRLNLIWCQYVNLDHSKHKDRHWYVTQTFAYGEMKYQATDWGYVAEDFEGSECSTLEEAQEELRDRLIIEIHKHKQIALRNIAQYNEDEMNMYDLEEYKKWLAVLNGEGTNE